MLNTTFTTTWDRTTLADGDLFHIEFSRLYANDLHFSRAMPPVGTIIHILQGAFTSSSNGGYVADSTVAISGHWVICDGSIPNDSDSPIWDTSTARVPSLTERYLRGNIAFGSNSVGGDAETTLIRANLPTHSHNMDHDHTLTYDVENGANDVFTVAFFQNAPPSTRANFGNTFNSGTGAWRPSHTNGLPAESRVNSFAGATGNGNGLSTTPFSNEPPYLDAIPYIRIK